MKHFSEKECFSYKTGYRTFRMNYHEASLWIGKIASFFAKKNITQHDKVILWGPNSPWWSLCLLACLREGIIAVPIDANSNQELVGKIQQQVHAKLIVRTKFKDAGNINIPTFFLEDIEHELKDFSVKKSKNFVKPRDIAEIVYTSGTTGTPKGVVLTHENIFSNIIMVQDHFQMRGKTCFLSLLPLSHLFEQNIGLFLPIYNDASIVYLKTLSNRLIMQACATEPITNMIVVPRILELFKNNLYQKIKEKNKNPNRSKLRGIFNLNWEPIMPQQAAGYSTQLRNKEEKFQKLLRYARSLPFSLRKYVFFSLHKKFGRHFKFFIIGGAPFEKDLEEFWNTLGFQVMQGYGLTETSPVLTCNVPTDWKVGSVGKVLDHVQITIKNGEVFAKGPNIFSGYYKNPEKTKETFEQGWFKTGDMGELDNSGFLFLKGRKKDMIVLPDGMNVYPEDIEAELNKEEEVKDSCVIWLGKIHAVVLLKPGKADLNKIIGHVNSRLQSHQQIQEWSTWHDTDFPRTPTLKIRKFKVLEYFLSHKTSQKIRTTEATKLQELIADVCNVALVKQSTNLVRDLSLSSLDRVELIGRMEDAFGIELDESIIDQKTKVEDLQKIIDTKSQLVSKMRFRTFVYQSWCSALRSGAQLILFFPFFRIFMRKKVIGKDNIMDVKGPVIFVANHESYLDPILLLKALPFKFRKSIALAAWKEFFDYKKGRIFHNLLKGLIYHVSTIFFGAYLFAQTTGILKSLENTGRLLDLGESVLIFPEGRRSVDGKMFPFKNGIGMLVQEMKVPVVPIKIAGMYELYNIHDRFPKHFNYPVTVKFGKPLYFDSESIPSISKKIEKVVRGM